MTFTAVLVMTAKEREVNALETILDQVTPINAKRGFINIFTERLHIGMSRTADVGTMTCKKRSANNRVNPLISNFY